MARLIIWLTGQPLFERFLAWLERRGRKWLLLNFDGSVAVERWYLLYLEADEDRRFIARFPNVYLHREVQLETPSTHRHAWNTCSLILAGGYEEEVDGRHRTHRAGDLAVLSHTQHHRITGVDPHTSTLFCHGFRQGPWAFKHRPCATLCGTCGSKYGRCINTFRETPYAANLDTSGNWRMTTWFPSTLPGLDKMIARRRRSLGRVRVLSRDEAMAQAARRIEA